MHYDIKTCSRTAEKEIISFTIELFIIQRHIVNRTLSKSRKTTVPFNHDEKKKRKKFESEIMIVISSRVFDANSFKNR